MLEVDHDDDLDAKQVCAILEAHLQSSKFLVSELLTLADISAVLSLKPHLEKAGAGTLARSFPATLQWYRACAAELSLDSGAGAPDVVARGPSPRFPYTEGTLKDSAPAAVYWAWFRKALGLRLHAAAAAAGKKDAATAILAAPTCNGLLRTCAEAFGK